MKKKVLDIQDYVRTDWQPTIIDPITADIVSKGTTFTTRRANNIEDGIYVNRELHKIIYDEMLKLRTELEIINRVPGGNSFFDTLSGEEDDLKGLYVDRTKTFASNDVRGNVVPVGSIVGFKVGEEYCLYDSDKHEFIKLKEIKENELVFESISGQFGKGSRIAKANVRIGDGMTWDYFTNMSVTGEVI